MGFGGGGVGDVTGGGRSLERRRQELAEVLKLSSDETAEEEKAVVVEGEEDDGGDDGEGGEGKAGVYEDQGKATGGGAGLEDVGQEEVTVAIGQIVLDGAGKLGCGQHLQGFLVPLPLEVLDLHFQVLIHVGNDNMIFE